MARSDKCSLSVGTFLGGLEEMVLLVVGREVQFSLGGLLGRLTWL